MDGYDRCENTVIDQIGTEAFLRGCRDKESARHVIERNPNSINNALKLMKASIANQRAIYGSRSPNFAHRQVSFVDSSNKMEETEKSANSPLEKEIRNLTQIVSKLAGIMISSEQNMRGRSPDRGQRFNGNRYRSPTPPSSQRSFSPQRPRSPSPSFRPNQDRLRRDSGNFRQRSPLSDSAKPLGSASEGDKPLNGNGLSPLANARS